MSKILITGGSGLIGKRLSKLLLEKGYDIAHLSRNPKSNAEYPIYHWNPDSGEIAPEAIEGTTHIIHLAGENVSAGRWSESRKKRIISSRVDTIALLLKKFEGKKLKAFISASGISYYGTVTSDQIFIETDPFGTDFLANVSVQWEKTIEKFNSAAERTVMVRTGVVLSNQGGALEKLVKPIKMGIGSPLGNGKQYVPWIHIDDICRMYLHIIQNEKINGAFNAVSSEHVTNAGLTKKIAGQLKKKLWAPNVPAFVLKALFGEMAQIILEGSRISNDKIKQTGFVFHYDRLDDTLENLLKN